VHVSIHPYIHTSSHIHTCIYPYTHTYIHHPAAICVLSNETWDLKTGTRGDVRGLKQITTEAEYRTLETGESLYGEGNRKDTGEQPNAERMVLQPVQFTWKLLHVNEHQPVCNSSCVSAYHDVWANSKYAGTYCRCKCSHSHTPTAVLQSTHLGARSTCHAHYCIPSRCYNAAHQPLQTSTKCATLLYFGPCAARFTSHLLSLLLKRQRRSACRTVLTYSLQTG
jgi:hypothetical protein